MVSIQPKPKKGLEVNITTTIKSEMRVSIQPKPKKGLEALAVIRLLKTLYQVSIQPKPKKGLEDDDADFKRGATVVSIQPKPKKGLEDINWSWWLVLLPMFQSSRSRRRV